MNQINNAVPGYHSKKHCGQDALHPKKKKKNTWSFWCNITSLDGFQPNATGTDSFICFGNPKKPTRTLFQI